MKILTIHSDFLKFQVKKKALKDAEESDNKEVQIKECLVVFTAVESQDESQPEQAAKQLAEEVEKIASQVKVKNIVLYPYAHLSSNLASPGKAIKILKEAEDVLSKDFKVQRAPFGYYKAFTISCKGHPLSELSREFSPKEEKLKTREEVVESIKRKHYILTPTGKEYKLNLQKTDELIKTLEKINDQTLSKYVFSEEIKGQPKLEPPSIKAMQQLELVDYAPECDPGNFKFYPKGNMIFELLKRWADKVAIEDLESIQIETPILYDWGDEEIREQAGSFHERHYSVKVPDESKKELILRFAGDFGLFKMMKRATISYRNLPLRVYEFSKSFRYEKRGELSGLKRLRAFHMPDIHSFCTDLEQGWDEYQALFKSYTDLANATKIEYAVGFRIVEEFYNKHKKRIIEMLKYANKPAFIETLSGMKHYWAVKHEFQGIDSVNGNLQLSTVQLDVKDAETYGITYADKDGKNKGCIICHSSIGSIERWMYVILEESLKKKHPVLPTWLSPTQIRLIPISEEKHLKHCEKIAKQLEKENIRVDIDDEPQTLSKKILKSEEEWVPYTIVIGDKELNSDKINVRIRSMGKQKLLTMNTLLKNIKKSTKNMPFLPLPLPKLLSKRPRFVG